MGRKVMERHIQAALIEFLDARGWLVERMIGNALQRGIPDLYCHHPAYEYRWIDVKRPVGHSFTKAQIEKWPKWEAAGVGIWILTAANDDEYAKLFRPANWRDYWRDSYGDLIDIDTLLNNIVL